MKNTTNFCSVNIFEGPINSTNLGLLFKIPAVPGRQSSGYWAQFNQHQACASTVQETEFYSRSFEKAFAFRYNSTSINCTRLYCCTLDDMNGIIPNMRMLYLADNFTWLH